MLHRSREEDRNQIVATRFFTTFSVPDTRWILKLANPVHKINYCAVMSACDKRTDDHACEDCFQTFSSLKGREALQYFCMWAFDDKLNKEAVFIAHNDSNYESHFILSCLVDNTEYPELLANGGNIMHMYIKACDSKYIDSCFFLSMPLSKFSDTFTLPDVV